MGSETPARARPARKGPLIVAALSAAAAVALVAAIAWTAAACGHRTTMTMTTTTVAVVHNAAVADFDFLQSGEYRRILDVRYFFLNSILDSPCIHNFAINLQ